MTKTCRSTRRVFLRTAAAFAVAPYVVTSAKGKERPAIVGSGAHTYECHHFWGDLPGGHEYGGASHGTAIDRDGLVYITHLGRPGSVFVFEPNGQFVRSMLPEHMTGKPGREGADGHGIDIRIEADGREYLYLSPAHPDLPFTKATINGEIVWMKHRKDLEKDADMKLERYRPTNASFGPDGSVYLGDGYGSYYIFHYSRDGKFLGVFGGRGKEDGKFMTPHGQWLDDRDGTSKTVVCDRANKRLQWFDLEGNHLRTQGGFLFPADIDIQGEVMLVPDLHARVTLLDGSNQPIVHLGDDEAWRGRVLDQKEKMRGNPKKWQAGKFIHPHDACFDEAGNIYVAEWVVGGRVTKLVKV